MSAYIFPIDTTVHDGICSFAYSNYFLNGVNDALIDCMGLFSEYRVYKITEGNCSSFEINVFVVGEHRLCNCGGNIIASQNNNVAIE